MCGSTLLIISQMKTGVFLCLVLLLAQVHSEALQLYTVSSSPTQVVTPYGSIRGGTTIYITGVGFSTIAANNQVTIGTYPCLIPAAGATETTISCVTSDTYQSSDIYNLPINVVSNGQQQSLTNEQGCFSYLKVYTPVVQVLYPASAAAGTYVNFYGIHRITNLGDGNRNMGDVISMSIGNALCGRFDIVQGPLPYPNSGDTISCYQALVQEGGKYQVVEYLTPGYSTPDPKLRRSSLLQENFHFAVLPAIYSFTPNSGAPAGQQLSINGTGFSTNSSVISVTVDGNTCDVTSSTASTINCNLKPRNSTLSTLLPTNSGAQTNGYISGTGLNYQRYDITNLANKNVAGFRAAVNAKSNTIVIQESSYRGQISTGNYYGTYYGEVFSGYFTAPVTGNYVFRGVADDIFAVYLSTTHGSAQPASAPLIYSNSVQNLDNFYINYVPTAEATVALTANMSYYMEVYHLNFAGPGNLRVSTQVPNSDQTLYWQTHAVQRLVLNFTNDPEIITFNQTGGTGGQINLTATMKPAGAPSYVVSAVIDYNANIAQFINALNTFDFFSPYSISGVLNTYDANGNLTTNVSQIVTYLWTISVYLLRPSTATKMVIVPKYINFNGAFTQTTVRPHGPIIGGSFGLSMAGNPITFAGSTYLRYNIAVYDLQTSIRQLPGFELVEVVQLYSPISIQYGITWLISYIGYNGPVPLFTTDNTYLLGGVAGTTPQVYSIEVRPYSSDLLVNPIDYPFFSTPSSLPNVLVTVNSVPSVCLGDCGYTFLLSSPQVTAASISGPTVTLSLTDPAPIGYSLSDVKITIGGQPCTIGNVTSPISSFTCQLPTNTDGTANVNAGSYLPVVSITQSGSVHLVGSITKFNFPLTLTSLSVSSGGANGGYVTTLTGTGFPTSLQSATVNICGQQATISSITNINAQIIVPGCAVGPTTVSISNGVLTSNTVSFTYNTPNPPAVIFSVSPQSYNPSLKGTMNITGVGFGVNQAAIRVDLANSSGKVYRMRILKLNDTYIKVGIPGGLTGKYKVQVNIIGVGQALPNTTSVNDFSYELIINSVTPSSGSYNGGTLINIKGVNFSPALDQTLVFIGNQLNWICDLESVNTTDILCRTPPINPYYNTSVAQGVVLTNRLMVDNTCGGACTFSYIDATQSPVLTSISVNSISTGSVTLTGSNLNIGTPLIILTNKKTGLTTQVTPSTTSATSLVFTVPNVESGSYNVKVRNDPIGESNGFLLVVTAKITANTPSTISTSGGRVVISGAGLPNGWPNTNFALKITQNKVVIQPSIFSATPTAFTVVIPASNAGDIFNISLTTPTNNVLIAIINSATDNTPVLALTTPASSVGAGSIQFTFSQSNLKTVVPDFVEIYSLYNSKQVKNGTISSASNGAVQLSAVLTGGKYGFRFFFAAYGWSSCASSIAVTISKPTLSALVTSYNGGSFVISGSGLSSSGTVNIGGIKTTLVNVTGTDAIAIVPPFVTSETQAAFSLAQPQKLTRNQYTIISGYAGGDAAFDGFLGTVYTSFNYGACFVGVDVGAGLTMHLSRVRFFPNSKYVIASSYFIGATLQASNDQTTWTTLATIDSTVHSGWNIVPITTSTNYRYVRFAHDTTSQCSLAELQIQAILQTDTTLANLDSNTLSVTYEDGASVFALDNSIEFRQDHTPIINSLSPSSGHVFGGYPITLNGNYLNFDTPSVIIDGIPCAVTAFSITSITCTVGARLTLPSSNSFVVTVGTALAITQQSFKYVMRWSDIRTWGTDMPPIDGDLVFVPAGMNLLVDQSTPKLQGILVQNGTLTFADESDMVISTGFITVVGGQFLAGTKAHPYQHQLTFILSGGYYSPQQPMFGNKGIACMQCFFSLHGQVRQYTWTMLSNSINIGDATITVQDAVDWRVGEQIVVASTSFDHYEAERRNIVSISGNSITVDAPFKNLHFAGVETYGNGKDKIEMRAEVGLLTRNIKVTGDDTSVAESYGAHLMLAGSAENGLVGQIGYTEFTKCGQPRIIGRYCIHFHMNGDVSDSFARGNAVHDSMARVITLHGVHYLTVQYNVGYNVMGHNYFIEDGIETHNLLQHNLAISSIQSWTMLQTDISVASFWVTHPTNHFRYNHAAGSDFYGFWYEIKTNPDGPSACNDVCPIGNPLGECHDNVAHSNVRFGLRIFKLAPRTYPCAPLYLQDTVDPWATNPGVISTFSNYVLYKNGESGLLAEETANLVFTNFTSAENKRSGAEFWITYFSKDLTVFKDSVIIGQTNTNSPQAVGGARGIITPRQGNIRIDNIRFYNYPADTHSLQTCSHCDNPLLFSNTAQEVYISNITFTNVLGNKLFMSGLKREILYDLDGTFTTNQFDGRQRKSAAVAYNYKHLQSDPACLPTSSTSSWDNTIICDQTVKLVRVTFNHLASDSLFSLVGLKAQEIALPTDVVPQNSTSYSEIYSFFSLSNKMDSMHDHKTYAMPYLAGRTYNIWWLTGLDFDHLTMTSSYYMKPSDPAVLFRFNYTLNRELYEIAPLRPNEPITDSSYFVRSNDFLDENSCYNGEYYHDNTAGNRTMQLCASAKNRTYFERTEVNAIYCRYLCPAPLGEFVKQDFVRYWSNATQWPQGRMPLPGENVSVNGNWTILMDVDPAVCEFMEIDGDVIIPNGADRNITCQSIWIRAGSLTAGSASAPFTNNLNIQLNGNKKDPGYVFDPSLQGNKIFVVTGKLNLYGVSPSTISAKLTQIANAGDISITVDAVSGWNTGDEIVIAPSFFNSREYERVTITGIAGNIVSFTPALKFAHYGDPSVTISNNVGTLDTRASVGHVTRNIKIVSGPDSGWGYSVVVYQMWDGKISRAGQATFSGVQFTLGGQYDTEQASLVLYNNMDTSTAATVVTASSFSFCRSFCIKGYTQNNAIVSNSVFYQARKFHFKLLQISSFTVTNNLMIGAIIRPTMTGKEPVACIQLTSIDPGTDNVAISNNVCQGSDLNGYVLPFVACSQLSAMPFTNNLAGTTLQAGFLLIRTTDDACLAFSGVRAYACKIGHISSPPNTAQLQITNYIIADSMRGISLRFGLAGTDRTAYFSDSYITQISRPNCAICYGPGKIDCTGNFALRMLAVTINGESYPKAFDAGYDGLCKEETFDSKAFLTNVVFDNYKQSYSQAGLSQCSNNVVFTTNHAAPDFVGGHHLFNCSCTNCELNALAYFDPPKQSELGWFGGCGNITCTGKNNYIVEDHSGTFLPGGGFLLANNTPIGSNTPGCSYVESINGHHCKRNDFGALQYESIAPDFNTRIMWPVSLTYEGGNWKTITNGFKEWEWIGNEPLNRRLARFITVIQLQKVYNMTFASNPPDDMRLQLQKRIPAGNNSDWVVVKLYYPFPNSIEVSVNGVISKPISLLDNNGQAALDTTTCGSNIFFYKNYTVHFVITGALNCLVRVRLTSSVQLTMRFSMNINDFFSSNGPTRLVDRMCAILQIDDQSRVKIVGIYTGSTEVVVLVTPPPVSEANSTSFSVASDNQQSADMKTKLDTAVSSGLVGSTFTDMGLLSVDSQVVPVHPIPPAEEEDDTSRKILIGVVTSVVGLLLIIGGILFYLKRQANNKVVDEVPEFSSGSEASHEKGKEEKQREVMEVQNITEENISEVIFDRPN